MQDVEPPPQTVSVGRPKIGFAGWWMLAVLLVTYVLAMMDRLILTMLVDPIQRDLGLDDFQIGLILGPAFAFSNAIAVYPLGWAVDRYNRKRLLCASVVFWSCATAACALARSFPGLILSRAGVAMGEATLLPAAYSMIAERFPRRHLTFALAVFGMGPKLGTAAAFVLGGAIYGISKTMDGTALPIVGQMREWQLALILVSALGILVAILVATLYEPRRKSFGDAEDTDPPPPLAPFLKERRKVLIPLFLGFSLMGICSGGMNNWVPTYLTREFGWGADQYGYVMGLISLVAASSILLKGFAVDWLFARGIGDAHLRFYTWLQAATLPFLIAAFLVSSPIAFLLLYGVVNVVVLSYLLYASAILQILAPSRLRGRVSSLLLFCSAVLAQGIGPSLVAAITQFVLQDQQRLGDSLLFVGAFALIASFVTFRFTLRELKFFLEKKE